MVTARGKGLEQAEKGQGGDVTWGRKHTTQYTDDVSHNLHLKPT